MKTKAFTVLILCLIPLLPAMAQLVEIRVVDEMLRPVANASVIVSYDTLRGVHRFYEPNEMTDKNGRATLRGKGPGGITFWAKKKGHYHYGYLPAERDRFAHEPMPDHIERELILKNIINPIPLYVRTIPLSPAAPFRIPAEKTWLGFDFEQGDWVAPHGGGKVADILFRYEREFHGIFIPSFTNITEERRRENIRRRYERQGKEFTEEKFREEAGKWSGVLEIAFPNEDAGILRVEEDFQVHSVLRMPHSAPEEGYQPGFHVRAETYAPPTHRDDVGFFLRTRVERDEDGKIVSAHYAKIHGDFQFGPVGYLSFTYYFNPKPNDRNLEFNGENLFPGGRTAMP